MDVKMEKSIDAIFSKWAEGTCPGGQVAIRKNGEIVYKKNFGYANIEHKIPMTDDTVLHVASVSKQITVMCILLLQEDGKLSIDDDIRDYVADLIQFSEPVTIRNMMNNVSGIRDQWELLGLSGVRIVDTITQKDALSIISKQKELNFEPLTKYLYSNSNFSLLAEIVERLSGKTLNEFATERIFEPLGMNNTRFKESYSQVIENRASSYADNGSGEYNHSVLNYGTYGATALNTTTTDFLKWMDNYRNPTICRKEVFDSMFAAPTLKDGKASDYAGGLFVGEYKGHKYIEHGGADASFRSDMLRFTEDDIDIVIFSNTHNIPMKDAAFNIADILFGHEKEEKTHILPECYVEDFDISDAPGCYFAHTPSGIILLTEIVAKEGKLYVSGAHNTPPLNHISGNQFEVKHMNAEIYLGEKSGLKMGANVIPLKKLHPFILSNENYSNYEGRYESNELDTTYHVIKEDDALYMNHSRNGKHKLHHIEGEKFATKGSLSTLIVEFIKESCEVTGLTLTGGRVMEVSLVKASVVSLF